MLYQKIRIENFSLSNRILTTFEVTSFFGNFQKFSIVLITISKDLLYQKIRIEIFSFSHRIIITFEDKKFLEILCEIDHIYSTFFQKNFFQKNKN